MTTPPLSSMLPVTEMPQPGTPAPAPVSPPAAPRVRAVSPFYYRYLRNQVTGIMANGGTDADVKQFLEMEQDTPLFRLPTPLDDDVDVPSNLRGVSMAALQGATFGWGDEALGAIYGKLTGLGARAGIDQYRREYEAWGREHGKTRFAAEVAGSLVTGGIGGVARAGVARTAARAGAAGAVAGAGTAEGGIGERTRGALLGAAFGAAAGGAVAVAGAVAKPILRPIAQRVTPTPVLRFFGATPEARAREHLARALAEDGLTPAQVTKAMRDLQAQGIPATILEVGGEATLQLARDVAATRSPLKTRMIEDLLGRQAEQGERLMAGLIGRAVKRNRFGTANAYDVEDALRSDMLTKSEPFYKDAFQQVVQVTPRMEKLLRHPKLRAAYNLGAKLAGDEDLAGVGHGLKVEPLAKVMDVEAALIAQGVPAAQAKALAAAQRGGPAELPVRGLDYMKRGLDLMIERGAERGRLDKQAARSLRQLRDDIIAEARTQVGAYDQALTTYGGYARSKEAVEAGREFLRRAPGEVTRELRKMTPNERDFYRIGAVQALYERVFSGDPSGNVARKYFGGNLFGGRSIQSERIMALFPDAPDAGRDFLRAVAGEARISYTTKRVARLPRAASVESREQAVEGAPLSVRGTLGVTIASAARTALLRQRARLSEDVSNELTHLFGKGLGNPAELGALVDDLFGTYARMGTAGTTRARVVSALGRVAGDAAAGQTQ